MSEYYSILGIGVNDDKDTIRQKYIALIKKYHPDRHGNKYLEKCKTINEAYSKIMKEKYGENNADIPQGFKNLGFRRVPTLDEYIRRIFTTTIKDDEEITPNND